VFLWVTMPSLTWNVFVRRRLETITATTELVCYAINYWDFRPFVIAKA
jgi:hypothetical protein